MKDCLMNDNLFWVLSIIVFGAMFFVFIGVTGFLDMAVPKFVQYFFINR